MIDFDTVVDDECFHIFWQRVGKRHFRAIKQDGDNRNMSLKRRGNFNSYWIAGIVNTPPPTSVLDGKPLASDNYQQQSATGHFLCQFLNEIGA